MVTHNISGFIATHFNRISIENNNIFIQGIIVSCVYLLFRFIEMRFIVKETIPLKKLMGDTLVVYISFVSGLFVFSQLEPIKKIANAPLVFTSNPDF